MSRHRKPHSGGWIWIPLATVGVIAIVAGAVLLRPESSTTGSPVPPLLSGSANGTVRQNDASAFSSVTGPLDPDRFHPRACVAFGPTGPSRNTTVFVDAGHGGPDMGGAGTTANGHRVTEKVISLLIAKQVSERLRADGFRVVMSRTADTAVTPLTPADVTRSGFTDAGNRRDLLARVRCANLSHAAALVSIHLDAYWDAAVHGATTIFDAVRPFRAENRRLAGLLQRHIMRRLAEANMSIRDRGVQDDTATGGGNITAAGTAYGHLILLGPAKRGHLEEPTTMPGALVEPAFLTNPEEAHIAATASGQHAIGTGIADGIERFLSGR